VNAAKHPACPKHTGYGITVSMRKTDDVTKQIERVQAFVASGRLSKYALANTASVGVATLTGLEKPDWNPLSSTLSALVRAIDRYEEEHGKAHPKKRAEARCEV
jgi:predicted transcriptional regulator